MAAGSDPKPSTPSLLERWRALAPAAPPPAPRRSRPPPPLAPPALPEVAAPPEAVTTPKPAPAADPRALLRKIEEAITAASSGERAALAQIALASLDPVRAALGTEPAARDPAALLLAFEQVEDLLEALLLAPEPAAASEG